MNTERKKIIRSVIKKLEKFNNDIDDMSQKINSASADEQASYEALPLGLRYSNKGAKLQNNAADLIEADSELKELAEKLPDLIEKLRFIINNK